ncbi:MAG: hypothetical protein WEB37_00045 [Bacteroidota bacterium]
MVTYSLHPDDSNRAEVRGLLQGRLEAALNTAMSDSNDLGHYERRTAPLWWGRWGVPSAVSVSGGGLVIREVGSTGFLFDITVFNGSHSGEASGFARIISKDIAYATLPSSSGGTEGELRFRRNVVQNGRREVHVEETSSCLDWHGVGVTFDNTFVHREERLFDTGVLDEFDLERLYSITGQYYEPMTDSFQSIRPIENADAFSAEVIGGGVRGLYTTIEGIIMKGPRGQLWAAYIDADVVRYFTTEVGYRTKLPETIERWRENFKEKLVVFDSAVVRIPKEEL